MTQTGRRIRKLRRQQGYTLQVIADQCGCTKSLLSKIESGTVNPTVATLTRIAKALGVTMGALLDNQTTTVFTRHEDITPGAFTTTEMGYAFFPFVASRVDKQMLPFLFTARKGEVRPTPLAHDGEEFIYMLEGEMAYRVGSVEYTLRPGDSLYFDACDEHGLTPLSDAVTYLAILSVPIAVTT